jgi:mono/diheme cytochrome c family protein
MKNIMKSLAAIAVLTLISCGGKEEKKKDGIQIGQKPAATETPKEVPASTEKPSEMVDLTNKGIGPIKNVEISATIDDAMAAKGMEVYKTKCMACHKPDKKIYWSSTKRDYGKTYSRVDYEYDSKPRRNDAK